MTYVLAIDGRNYRNKFKRYYLEKLRRFSSICIAFLESTQNFGYLEVKDQLHSLNILEVIDPEICGYSNARKLLF